MKLAIIGTAGKGENPLPSWSLAFNTVRRLCVRLNEREPLELGSGGAAWGDSIAPRLFLEGVSAKLDLFLPVSFGVAARRFDERGEKSAGAISNKYHLKALVGGCPYDSLQDLAESIDREGACTVHLPQKLTYSYKDFFERNRSLALWADGVVAVTFGKGLGVADGGTLHTVNEFLRRGVRPHVTHVDLSTGQVYLANPNRVGA